MTGEITANGSGGAVAVNADFLSRFRSGISASRQATPRIGGMHILRLLKDGAWVYGPEAIEVEQGSNWIVNTLSAEHGYVCWSKYGGNRKDEILGEKMCSVVEPKPDRPQPIQGYEWSDQRTFILKCLDGEDAGTQVIYKIASIGGLNEVDELLATIEKQLAVEGQFICPVVTMETDFYIHTKWGKTYTPVFKVMDWADINGVSSKTAAIASPAAATAQAAPVETVAAAKAEPAPAPVEAAAAATEAPKTRRRPR